MSTHEVQAFLDSMVVRAWSYASERQAKRDWEANDLRARRNDACKDVSLYRVRPMGRALSYVVLIGVREDVELALPVLRFSGGSAELTRDEQWALKLRRVRAVLEAGGDSRVRWGERGAFMFPDGAARPRRTQG